jgi:hypothetical protein
MTTRPASAGPGFVHAEVAASPTRGISFVPLEGWQVMEVQEGHLMESLLRPEPSVTHLVRIAVMKADTGGQGIGAAFGANWPRMLEVLRQGGATIPGSDGMIAHYWSHLPCGLPVYWMGRFFYNPDPRLSVHAVLYTIGLPGGTQTVLATATPLGGSPSLAMNLATSARLTLLESVERFFSSVQGPGHAAPEALLSSADVVGTWEEAVATPGMRAWSSVFGAFAGHVGTGHREHYGFDEAGVYEHRFTVQNLPSGSLMPSHITQEHEGRWRLEGDIIHLEPSRLLNRDTRVAVVGGGWREAARGRRRLLLLSAASDGQLRRPDLVPDGAQLDVAGTAAKWYEELDQ